MGGGVGVQRFIRGVWGRFGCGRLRWWFFVWMIGCVARVVQGDFASVGWLGLVCSCKGLGGGGWGARGGAGFGVLVVGWG